MKKQYFFKENPYFSKTVREENKREGRNYLQSLVRKVLNTHLPIFPQIHLKFN